MTEATMGYLLTTLKIVSGIITGAYGIYATVTDFHEDKNGKKVLSRPGRRAIAVMIVGTAISVGIELGTFVKEARKRDQDARDERTRHEEIMDKSRALSETLNEQQKMITDGLRKSEIMKDQLDQTKHQLQGASNTVARAANTVDSVLHESIRQSEPFSLKDRLTMVVDFRIPVDQPLVRPYFDRIINHRYGDEKPAEYFDRSFPYGSMGFPDVGKRDEELLFKRIVPFRAWLTFRKLGQTIHDFPLAADFECDPSNLVLGLNKGNEGSPTYLAVECQSESPGWRQYDTSFSSYVDFDQASVLIHINHSGDFANIKFQPSNIYWSRVSLDRKHPDLAAYEFKEVCSTPPYIYGHPVDDVCFVSNIHLRKN